MAFADAFLTDFDREMDATRRALEHLPAHRLDFRPHPRARSAGELAMHLARIPGWVGALLDEDAHVLAAPGAPPQPEPTAPLEGTLARFDANRDAARARIAARDDAALAAPWRLERGGRVLETMPRTAALRRFVLDHLVHHRGQLTVYLRLLDAPVPGFYGPSADERDGRTGLR